VTASLFLLSEHKLLLTHASSEAVVRLVLISWQSSLIQHCSSDGAL